MQSITVCNAATLLLIKRKGKVGQYVKDTGLWECSQMQLSLNPNEATLSIPAEVVLLAFKDGRQHQLGVQCTKTLILIHVPSGNGSRFPNNLTDSKALQLF